MSNAIVWLLIISKHTYKHEKTLHILTQPHQHRKKHVTHFFIPTFTKSWMKVKNMLGLSCTKLHFAGAVRYPGLGGNKANSANQQSCTWGLAWLDTMCI